MENMKNQAIESTIRNEVKRKRHNITYCYVADRPARPADIAQTVISLAGLLQMPKDLMQEQISKNLNTLEAS